MATPKHFLDLDQVDPKTLRQILDHGKAMKKARLNGGHDKPLGGKTLAMIFEKPSTRTRVSFEVGMRELGGQTIMLGRGDTQLGRGETIADTARVLSRYVDIIMIRTTVEEKLLEMAKYATVPVINGLTDKTHPCQLMADVMTYEEHRGPIRGKAIAWSGDGNNMATSWIHAAVQFDFELRVACPPELKPPADVLAWAEKSKGQITIGHDPESIVRGADCVVTDTWVSMGDEDPDSPGAARLPGRLAADGAGQEGRHLHALPAGAPRRGGHGRRDRRAAVGGVRRGGEPPARAEVHPRLVSFLMASSEDPRSSDERSAQDGALPFQLDALGVRGRLVRLGPSLDAVIERHGYPLAGPRAPAQGVGVGAGRAAPPE